jgi:hypothetical protein
MKFRCLTTFDITATGVTGHFKTNRIPFEDKNNNEISNIESWNRARNQQRNWETITQIISLRTQITEITEPKESDKMWYFTFTAESPGAYGTAENPTAILFNDCADVPMIVDLASGGITGALITHDEDQNIWFYPLEDTDEY